MLLVYTLLMLPILLYLRRSAGQQLIGRLATFIGRRYAIFLLALPIAIVEAALGSSMSGSWNEIAYVVFLIYGYLLAADARSEQAFCRHWQSSLVIALMGSIAAIGALTVFVAQAGVAPANPLVDYDVISVMLRYGDLFYTLRGHKLRFREGRCASYLDVLIEKKRRCSPPLHRAFFD